MVLAGGTLEARLAMRHLLHRPIQVVQVSAAVVHLVELLSCLRQIVLDPFLVLIDCKLSLLGGLRHLLGVLVVGRAQDSALLRK